RGDVELWMRNMEVVRSWPGLRSRRDLVATAGERLALERNSYTGDTEGGRFEGEFLRLIEIDAHGKLVASMHFEIEDRRSAFAEMQERFVAGEAAGAPAQACLLALLQAMYR